MTRGSYLLIEPGMSVQGADGESLGTVTELVADESADIFRGIVLTLPGSDSPVRVVFMPGEHITAVEAQTIFTDLNREAAAQLKDVNSSSPVADERNGLPPV